MFHRSISLGISICAQIDTVNKIKTTERNRVVYYFQVKNVKIARSCDTDIVIRRVRYKSVVLFTTRL